MSRYNRHHILQEIGTKGQDLLSRSSVLIVGVGGLGSPIALYLAAAGVGRIGLVDADIVSQTNLQRQVLYADSQVGLAKVDCAKERLLSLNPEIEVETYNLYFDLSTADEIVRKYDIVVDGCDNYSTRYLIDEMCLKYGKPYIYGAISEFEGQVSVFNYQGSMRYLDLYPDKDYLCSLPKVVQGVLGTVPAVIGSIQATEAIKVLLKRDASSVLANRIYTINLLTMESHTLNLV